MLNTPHEREELTVENVKRIIETSRTVCESLRGKGGGDDDWWKKTRGEELQHNIHDGSDDDEEWKHFVEMKQKKTMRLFNLPGPCFEYVGRLDLLRDLLMKLIGGGGEKEKEKEKEKERNDDERKGTEEQEGKRQRKMIGLTGGSVMTGMGGAGKTETAILVGHLLCWYFRGNVRMMRAENEMRLWESTLSLGEDLGLKLKENEMRKDFIGRVYKELGCLERCLLIFDNAQHFEVCQFFYFFSIFNLFCNI
jgi:hypothetical protein